MATLTVMVAGRLRDLIGVTVPLSQGSGNIWGNIRKRGIPRPTPSSSGSSNGNPSGRILAAASATTVEGFSFAAHHPTGWRLRAVTHEPDLSLAAVRRQIWREQGFRISRHGHNIEKPGPALQKAIVVYALCDAA